MGSRSWRPKIEVSDRYVSLMKITYKQAESKTDLEGILHLQKANLAQGLSKDEIQSQGFVTVHHTYDLLKLLNDREKHVIAKADEQVVDYVLAMTKDSRFDIPVLVPMFEVFDKISFKDRKVAEYNFIVVGQVCISKEYRGQGVFDNTYNAYRDHYKNAYDFAITEIASTNTRSLNAHHRIGFREIGSYIAPDNTKWIVVVWEWKNG